MSDENRLQELEQRMLALELLVKNLVERVDRALAMASNAEAYNRPIGYSNGDVS